jgi:hypothetical protein
MSYAANEIGEIDPVENVRVDPAAGRGVAPDVSDDRNDAIPAAPAAAVADAVPAAATPLAPDDAELRRRAELAEQRLYDRLADLQGALEDMRRERDAWREQAQRLPASAPRTAWWRRRRKAG